MRLKLWLLAVVLCAGVGGTTGCAEDVGLVGFGGKCATTEECGDGLVCFSGSCHNDGDGDGVPDVIDNCPNVANPLQEDLDNNGVGDVCEKEQDKDPVGPGGACTDTSQCQSGLACYEGTCQLDSDGDGVPDEHDNCPNIANPDQLDSNNNGVGDACDVKDPVGPGGRCTETSECQIGLVCYYNKCQTDRDGDGIPDDHDNCPDISNPDQADADNNGVGDACEVDDPIDPNQTRRDGLPFDPTCKYVASPEPFTPELKWEYKIKGSHRYATHPTTNQPISQVMMTPVVADLDGDGMPDVIYTTFSTNNNQGNHDELRFGVLRAVAGDGSKLLWSVGHTELGLTSRQGVQPAGNIAVGDITGNGKPEIIVGLFSDTAPTLSGIAAITHDGKLLWKTTEGPGQFEFWYGGPSIADLDGDGKPEIIVGSYVYDNQGNLKWAGKNAAGHTGAPGQGVNWASVTGGSYGTPPTNLNYSGMLSVVADLDVKRDPITNRYTQEVVTGRAAYTHDGKLLWESPVGLPDGYPAIGDFNGDGFPEVVIASRGRVRIQDGQTGKLLWGPVEIPGSGRIGAPTIADFDGDGFPEIGIAGSNRYYALKVDIRTPGHSKTPSFAQVKLWEAETQDVSSSMTGSSVFDFDGDGKAEVVYNDELYLRVFDGKTGAVIFIAPNTSYTATEYPVIVDVNNDGAANIVVATNDFECGDKLAGCVRGFSGLRVFGDKNSKWVATRKIWNQHAYSINNVEDNGKIPAQPGQSWVDHNTYRLNQLNPVMPKGAPDLRAELGSSSFDGCSGTVRVWVTNSGAVRTEAGISVSFYAMKGANSHYLGQGKTLAALEPGESERVDLNVTIPVGGPYDLVAVADDVNGTRQGTRNECNENNNSQTFLTNYTCS